MNKKTQMEHREPSEQEDSTIQQENWTWISQEEKEKEDIVEE